VPDNVTRYGKVHEAEVTFGAEKRFQWQSSGATSDVVYDVQDSSPTKSAVFGSSLRKGMDEENPDAKKRSTGPGSYDVAGSYDHNSEYAKKDGNRFGQAPRESMAMKTPSPGAVYNIEHQFYNGPEKANGIGFGTGARGELHGSALGSNADMYVAKGETGPAVTIAKKLQTKELGADTPGAIYDVHEKKNFQTGPSFSFGHGKDAILTSYLPLLPHSPVRSSSVPDNVTRYGKLKEADLTFGTEERFKWQTSGETSDVVYDVQNMSPSRSVVFGSALRKGLDDENPDAKKRSTGPGSYDFAHSYDHNSEYVKREGNRFGQAPRQSMAMKTPSAGAVYNIDKQFWNGPERTSGVGFSNGSRGDLYGSSLGANADMYVAKPEHGHAVTIGKKLQSKELGADTPGAIYDVHERKNFQTGPSYSFYHGGTKPEMLPEVSRSPARSPSKADNRTTRYGKIKDADLSFGTEQRFKWQSSGETSDVVYDVQNMSLSKSAVFGSSLRKGMEDENPDAKKRSTGPGSYDVAQSYDFNSEYAKREANRFGQAPRQSMAMKTPSAGAVYNIEKQYWNGPDKSHGVGFATSARGELHGNSEGANADMYCAKPDTGHAITIGARFKSQSTTARSPGAVYDVHVSYFVGIRFLSSFLPIFLSPMFASQKKVDFRTGPSYSFGNGKGKRFNKTGYLPEIIREIPVDLNTRYVP